MILLLDGGLNLNSPLVIGDTETAVALNADFRKKGVVRSRDGRASIYTSQGVDFIGTADGDIYSAGSYIFQNGVTTGQATTGVTATGTVKLWQVANEVWLVAAQNNYKVDGSSVTLWGIAAPTVAPTAVALAGGSMAVGSYYYKYTYARYSGGTLIHESNPSPVSSVVALSGGNLQVTFTGTASSDGQVTHINVYRTLLNGASGSDDFFFDQSITLPTVTATSSNTDGQLGALVEVDNDPPPSGVNSIAGPGAYAVVFVAVGNTVYFSKGNRPESFPSDYYLDVGVPSQTIQALVDWSGLIFIFTTIEIYFIQGTDADTFYPIRTQSSRGLVAKQAVAGTPLGIAFLAYDGLYMFNGQSEVKLSGEKVDSIFRGETINDVSPMNKDAASSCWLVYWNGKLMLGYPTAGNTTPDKVLVFDLEEKKWSIYDYGINLKSAFVDVDGKRLLAGDTSGTLWQLESGQSDAGTSFTFKVRSKELSSLAAQAPAFMRFNVLNTNRNTITARLLSKGTTVRSQSLTDSREFKRRVIGPSSFDSLQVEFEGTVTGRVEVGPVELT